MMLPLISSSQIEASRSMNQAQTLQKAKAIPWSISHLQGGVYRRIDRTAQTAILRRSLCSFGRPNFGGTPFQAEGST